MPLRAGEKLGRYEVRDYLRQDEDGAVYRGYAESLSQEVAIVAFDVLVGGAALDRFREQARGLVQLRHPNIHPVLDFGEHEGVPYVVQPLVQRVTLTERRHRGGLGGEAALRLLKGIASAVDYAHGQAIVHGDLTPARVLVDTNDHPLVTGFGMASLRSVTSQTPPTWDPLYASPERVARGELSADADRYAFATITYEVLAGTAPFQGRPPGEVPGAQLSSAPPPASSRNRWLGPAVDAVLNRGLAKDPNARWPSCVQLVQALERALAGRQAPAPPLVAPAPSPARRAAPAGSRRPTWILAGVGVLVVLAAALAVWIATRAGPPSLNLSQVSAEPGQQITIQAANLPSGQAGSVQISSRPRQIARFHADNAGTVFTTVTIPADIAPGGHQVSLCWNGSCPVSSSITIVGPSPSPVQAATPTPTVTPTATPTPEPTPTPTPAPTARSTPAPAVSPTPTFKPHPASTPIPAD